MARILIANRGEIACRVIAACRLLGHIAVAVYSEADASARHVRLADEAYPIGPAPALESYLNADKIIALCDSYAIDAVHPGYGFLAEKATFARAVQSAGLVWIGPAPATIETMGDKARARGFATSLDVPVIPGSPRFEEIVPDSIMYWADEVDFPLLVKAAGGGGGIGMRRVESKSDILALAQACQEQSAKLFGNGTIYLERAIQRARHVEVQIVGDGRGRAIHLWDRDCSIQRRFQKIIEEAPSPDLPASIRSDMLACAVRLAEAQDYLGPGTVEFLYDGERSTFYFLEMNTRIQVEHPVSEVITGIDLVALQINLALGTGTLPDQQDVGSSGHAIECRLCAENPAKGFLPSPGLIERLQWPDKSAFVRVDTGYEQGDRLSPYYDSLVGKLIVSGSNRAEAVERMREALRQVEVKGVASNLDMLRALVAHPAFERADLDTDFVSRITAYAGTT